MVIRELVSLPLQTLLCFLYLWFYILETIIFRESSHSKFLSVHYWNGPNGELSCIFILGSLRVSLIGTVIFYKL